MPVRLQVELSEAQAEELRQARDRHRKAYVREAAAAILKVAQGQSARQVALTGLLKVRDPETMSDWIDRYRKAGVAGLEVQAGRGRKRVFSPSVGGRSASSGPSGRRA